MQDCDIGGKKELFIFEPFINIRPSADNRSMQIQDSALRSRINTIVKSLLGDVQWQ